MTTSTKVLFLSMSFALVPVLCLTPASASGHKCKTPACDINAIGHRKLFNGPSSGNWFSTEKEKELGDKFADAIEQKVDLLKDAGIMAYIDQVTQRVVQNSDANMPIAVRILRKDDAGAFTVVGGHLYLTTGLLLKLHSEGELASVLARGIAHTALHSVARLQTRSSMLQLASETSSVPVFAIGNLPAAVGNLPAGSGNIDIATAFGLLKFQREFELEADYFGVQYVYKSGYDPNCFLSAVQILSQPEPHEPLAKALDPFPPVEDRLKRLHQEIDSILPEVPRAIVFTPSFDEFMSRLRQIQSAQPNPERAALSTLMHPDCAGSR